MPTALLEGPVDGTVTEYVIKQYIGGESKREDMEITTLRIKTS
jgi:hypothetical protein